MVSLCVVRNLGSFVVGVDSMLKIVHICVTSHFLWFKRENLEWTSLFRVRQALPVAVIGPEAAAALLPRWRAAALRRC